MYNAILPILTVFEEEKVLMKLEQVDVKNANQLLQDYREQKDSIMSFFHFKNEQASFAERLKDLQSHKVRRAQLTTIIRNYMSGFESSKKIEQHLAELEKDAVVVVGGQQSGLLTGPLYSVNKAISVLLLAKEQREKLGVPVVPVFWVAGEDHDLDEINHTFYEVNGRLIKHAYNEQSPIKKMASAAVLEQAQLTSWIQTIFSQFGETQYTKELLADVLQVAGKISTYTEFFVTLMNGLFKEQGLLYVDAADEALRRYEAPYFKEMIEHSQEIAQVVTAREQRLEGNGYAMPIGATENAANLFYVREGERFLLTRKEGRFMNQAANISFSKEEMLKMAEDEACFSNNVVTRPMMQDLVFPVLSFVGGPGELAYWSTLKEGFEILGTKVPVFTPRMNLSYVTRETAANLELIGLTAKQAIEGGVAEVRQAYESKIYDAEAKEAITKAKQLLAEQYEVIQKHLAENEIHLERVVDKNLLFHQQQFDFLMKQIEKDIHLKHDVAFKRFKQVEGELLPAGGFQERVYTPYPYLNQYGVDFVADIMKLPLQTTTKHQIIYL